MLFYKPHRSPWAYLTLSGWLLISVATRTSHAADTGLRLVSRAIAQQNTVQDKASQDPKWFWQAWQVDYLLAYEGSDTLITSSDEVSATVQGWLSNSRIPGHNVPRFFSATLSSPSGFVSTSELVTSTDETKRCREQVSLEICTQVVPVTAGSRKGRYEPVRVGGKGTQNHAQPIVLTPGVVLQIRLQLVHQHFLYGMYDPLLGTRILRLQLGPIAFCDRLPLDREQYTAQCSTGWTEPPEEHRSVRYYVSPPDSLHLDAHIPGNQYYRFPEQPVRYSTKMRLRYWYLVAPGTEGECKARIAQYKDTPTAWKVLSEGSCEQRLTTVGRWVRVDCTFRTEPEATTLALDFRLCGDVGELWIDDVVLEPVSSNRQGP